MRLVLLGVATQHLDQLLKRKAVFEQRIGHQIPVVAARTAHTKQSLRSLCAEAGHALSLAHVCCSRKQKCCKVLRGFVQRE